MRREWQRGSARGQMQKSPSVGKFHGDDPSSAFSRKDSTSQQARGRRSAIFRPGLRPQRVISLGGDWGRGPVYVRSASNRVEILCTAVKDAKCKVEMWRGGCRSNISVSASFVWRCLSGATMTPFPHPSHRTGHEDFPHPALGQDFTPSPTARRAQAGTGARARSARKGARVDKLRPCVA